MSDDNKLSRRQFLERAAALGAVTLGAGSLLSACDPPEPDADEAEPAADDVSCNDDEALAALSEDEIEQRNNHDYVDDSPEEGEYCDNCIHWQEPEAGDNCGGCAVLPGPFHPKGWCDLWQPAA